MGEMFAKTNRPFYKDWQNLSDNFLENK